MNSNETHRRRLHRARSYPYDFPARSFTYANGAPRAFDATLTDKRTPVLAIGSNQSPQRLLQKFGHDSSHVIPVQRAQLADFDVVFSAHISSYGAVPAMLQTSPGASVALAVTWLNDEQLEIMHHSEIAAANYCFAELQQVSVTLDDGAVHTLAFAYLSSRGHLSVESTAVALSAIDCTGRQYPAMTTGQALEHVRGRIAQHLDADQFVHKLVEDREYRQQVIEAISQDAGAFHHPMRIVRGVRSSTVAFGNNVRT
jgi:hypothetical protein